MRRRPRAIVVVLASLLLAGLVPTSAAVASQGVVEHATSVEAAVPTAIDPSAPVPIYRFYSPTYKGHFYTADAVERDKVISQWSKDWTYEGEKYWAFTTQVAGTVPLYRFWSAQFGGHFFTADESERERVATTWPDTWSYEGIAYYVYPAGADVAGSAAVYRFWGAGVKHHFYTADVTERDRVRSQLSSVWTYESERFRVPAAPVVTGPPSPTNPSDGNGRFTVATYPDTQQEVFDWAGSRFLDRATWLVTQKAALDLRFVMHTGDVVNWDTDAHEQYVKAEAALDPLEAAGIPYQLSIGNHDTLATGPGGGARDSRKTREYQRTTTTFNQFWKAADYGAVAGQFESGKVDNTYSTFTAEGADWLVLNLELWPRVAAVDWAEAVIASHPTHNVIIQTHSFLGADMAIDGAGQSVTRWGYGDSSPQYVYDRLVDPYSNVKVVTSGHTGSAGSKIVATTGGNRVAFLLQTLHSNTNNPVRLSEFDVAAGTISTRVYAPEDATTWDVNTLTGLTFITR